MQKEFCGAVRSLIKEFDKVEKETQELGMEIDRLPQEEREATRELLYARAEELRKNYGWSLPVIRQFLREMIEVSV